MADSTAQRLLEDAADALARLDATCLAAPRAFSIALRLAAASALARAGVKGTHSLASTYELGSPDQVDTELLEWMSFIDEEERRARGGASLTLGRFARVAANVQARTDGIERALRGAHASSRPSALHRALDVAAWMGDRAPGEAAAALVLCAEGRTAHVRLLPFEDVEDAQREDALRLWRDGDEDRWSALALEALTARARRVRAALETAQGALPRQDSAIDALGRAGITARRAMAELRTGLVTTVPLLASELGLSRPAADDALLRLSALGLVVEISGRKRDRVFAYAAALVAVE